MGWLCIKWWLALFCAVMVQINGCNGYFPEEKKAILDYKEFLKFHNYSAEILFPSWVSDPQSDYCAWENVTCDSSTGHVIDLSLEAKYQWIRCDTLSQHFSLNLSLFQPLKELRSLILSSNCFNGLFLTKGYRSLPILKKLETLDLTMNPINLTMLTPLRALTSLKNLIIGSNHIEGSFPFQELSGLQNLDRLDLSGNRFSSPSTAEDLNALPKLKKLKYLDLGSNNFDQKILKYLFALPNVTSLFIDNNGIKGALNNQGLCNMKTLQHLDLSFNNFSGKLDTCLGNLTSLRTLNLTNNKLSESIPSSSIASLASLEYLSLSPNNFEGSFSLSCLANHSRLQVLVLGGMNSNKFQVDTEDPPNWIPSFQLKILHLANCQLNSPTRKFPSFLLYQHGLEYIDLSKNNLVGVFPNWLIENNSKLEFFFLNDNSFNGSFQLPTTRINQFMDKLVEFDISNNKIQGSIPTNIGFFFPHLRDLTISNNKLDGEVPASVGEMLGLRVLNLAYNNLSGEIPKQILQGCTSLFSLKLSHNNLQGQIFPIASTSLFLLMMNNNQFNGTIEEGMLNSMGLWVFDISNNKLSGRLPANWPMGLGFFSVSSNNFEGEIPKELFELNLLHSLDLSHNRFFGSIPSNFKMLFLNTINLQGNSLTGTIPEVLSTGHELEIIDLRDNKLSASIPTGIYGLSNLKFLLLAGNALQGELSKEICNLKGLNYLDLSRNNFTGSIPSCFNNISFAKDDLHVQRFVTPFFIDPISLNGYQAQLHQYESPFDLEEKVLLTTKSLALSYEGNILNYMSGLDLSFNQLTGQIPSQLGELPTLRALNLSHNHLNETIPESFHKLDNIESLDLSYNNLSGSIPLQLQDLNYLSKFNVSYNNLSGRVPDQNQFGSFEESSYYGNLYLHWNISNRGTPTSPSPVPSSGREKDESAIEFTAFFWSFGASFVMIQLILIVVLWINPYWRRKWFYFIETCLYKCFGQFFPDIFY